MPSSSLSSHGKALCLERLQAAGAKAASKAELDVTYDQPKELIMSTTEMSNEQATNIAAAKVDMKLEVVVIPVSDVERAKRFYSGLGWRLDADFARGDELRVVQFTPPGSGCSIHFGKGMTCASPDSARGLYLVVFDIEAARAELMRR